MIPQTFRLASHEFAIVNGALVYRIGVALDQSPTVWYGEGASYGEAVDEAARKAVWASLPTVKGERE